MLRTAQPMNAWPNLVQFAHSLDWLRTANAMSTDGSFDADSGRVSLIRLQMYATLGLVKWAMWKGGDVLFVAFGGLDQPSDCSNYFANAANLTRYSTMPGTVLSMASQMANLIYTTVRDQLDTTVHKAWFVGHSFGGEIAALIAWSIKNVQPTMDVGYITFGTPRFCDADAGRALAPLCWQRVMNYGDPVTYLMPTITQAPTMHARVDRLTSYRWLSQVNVGEGLVMTPQGNSVLVDTPQGVNPPWELGALGWALGINDLITPHRMTEYRRRLDLRYPVDAGDVVPTHAPRSTIPTDGQPTVVPLAQIPAQVQAAQAEVVNPIIPANLTQVHSRVHVRRVQRRWFVYLDGNLYYSATSRSDALGVANALRRYMNQVVQNPNGFQEVGDLHSVILDEQTV